MSVASTVPPTVTSLEDLDYELPRELIAQHPASERDRSRLMVVDRAAGTVCHHVFATFPDFFDERDLIVANDSRVVPARVYARKPSGGVVELLVLAPARGGRVRALAKTSKPLRVGHSLALEDGTAVSIAEVLGDGRYVLDTESGDWNALIETVGRVPLPPYIRGGREAPEDRERYQTVYAAPPGSVAAPTAGLHFTPEVLQRVGSRGTRFTTITLHVGPATFAPLRSDPSVSVVGTERAVVPVSTVDQVASTRRLGGRVTAIGTTTVRALETAADPSRTGGIRELDDETSLFIQPGYRFSVCDRVLTNFHLPRSTLLCLVMAFAGQELIRHAYQVAVRERYRFYSYGDVMLIL